MPCRPARDARVAERRRHGLLRGVLQRVQVVETGAGDDAERRARHAPARYRSASGWSAPGQVPARRQDARMSDGVAIAATGPVPRGRARGRARRGQRGRRRRRRRARGDEHRARDRLARRGRLRRCWPADGEPVVIDGNVEMPGRGLPVDRFGAGVEEVVTEYAGGRHPMRVTARSRRPAPSPPASSPSRSSARPGRRRRAVETGGRDGYPIGAAAARYLSFTAHSLFGRDLDARVVTREDGTPAGTRRRRDQPGPRRRPRASAVRGPRCSPPARSAARWPTTWPGTAAL